MTPTAGGQVLLLVDAQNDYLDHPGLTPDRETFVVRLASIVAACRSRGIPVWHVHTRVRVDGSDRMPHLREANRWSCVEDTPGCAAPEALAPTDSEPIYSKQFFDGFADPALRRDLAARDITTVFLAGVHTHACIRETALAAYGCGYLVRVLDDGVASYDPLHAEITRAYLDERGLRFITSGELLDETAAADSTAGAQVCPATFIDGAWQPAASQPRWLHHDPADWDTVLAAVPLASVADCERATEAAAARQADWQQTGQAEKASCLRNFLEELRARKEALTDAMVAEIGKPVAEARAEIDQALAHIESALDFFATSAEWEPCRGEAVFARRVPVGTVALVTPWNNPVAIPVGKIAPALLLGNAVVWKPALPAAHSTRLVLEALAASAVPDGLVNAVFGDAGTARRLMAQPLVTAVSLTGNVATGRSAAALCARHLKPLQAELGGNNAVVVLADFDVETAVREIVASAFSFSGQRCTAPRRLLVQRDIAEKFTGELLAAVDGLRLGDPRDPATVLGPLVSRTHQQTVGAVVEAAVAAGASVLRGGRVPPGMEHGCWYEPTVLSGAPMHSAVVNQETFGPLVVMQEVADLRDAIARCNAVPQGLVATLFSHDPAAQATFREQVQAGILKCNQAPAGVVASAPFGGWKESGLGPPEHGPWDRDFYTRPQALYGFTPS